MVNLNLSDDIPIYTYNTYTPPRMQLWQRKVLNLGFPRFLTWQGEGYIQDLPYWELTLSPISRPFCEATGGGTGEYPGVSVHVGPRKTAVGWLSQSFPPAGWAHFFSKRCRVPVTSSKSMKPSIKPGTFVVAHHATGPPPKKHQEKFMVLKWQVFQPGTSSGFLSKNDCELWNPMWQD